MALFRPDRSRPSGEDPFLLWKVRLLVVGGGLGIAGMVKRWEPLVWGGMAVLAAAVALRFAGRRREEREAGDADTDDGTAPAGD